MTNKKRKVRKLNKKIVGKMISIVMIVIAIFIFVAVGKQVRNMYTLTKQAKLVEEELIKLQDENAALYTTKNKLEDPNYVTTFARGEYMFSKGDEKVFYLPSNNNDEASQ